MEQKTIIKILIGIIVVMALIGIYFLILKPTIDNYALNNQIIGYEMAINQTLLQLQQYGYVTMLIGNQTLYLVPYNPNQNSTG